MHFLSQAFLWPDLAQPNLTAPTRFGRKPRNFGIGSSGTRRTRGLGTRVPRPLCGIGFQGVHWHRSAPAMHRRSNTSPIRNMGVLRKMDCRHGHTLAGQGPRFRRGIEGGPFWNGPANRIASVLVSARGFRSRQGISTGCRMEAAPHSNSWLRIRSERTNCRCLWKVWGSLVPGVWHRMHQNMVVQSGRLECCDKFLLSNGNETF